MTCVCCQQGRENVTCQEGAEWCRQCQMDGCEQPRIMPPKRVEFWSSGKLVAWISPDQGHWYRRDVTHEEKDSFFRILMSGRLGEISEAQKQLHVIAVDITVQVDPVRQRFRNIAESL